MALRFSMPIAQWVNSLGTPLAGGKLYFYTTLTSTPLDTYSNNALTTPNTNPVIADSTGTWGDIFLSATDYKVVLKTSAGVEVATIDPVHGGIAVAITASDVTYTPTGTGGQARTVTAKLGDDISTADYDTLAHAVTAAGVTQEINLLTNTHDEDTIWSGREHKSTVSPYLVNSVTWTGAALNAGMDVANRVLFVCEFDNNKIAFLHLDNPRKPVMWRRMACGTGPRWCKVYGQFLIVACATASTIEIYDISNLGGPAIVGAGIAVGTTPKQFDIDGTYLYLACYGTNKVEKWLMVGFGPGGVPTLKKVTDVTVSATPLCVKSNGAGVLACVGINGDIRILSAVGMTSLSTTAIVGAAELAFCAWISQSTLLVTDKRGRLYTVDVVDPSTPTVIGYISISTQPEMVIAIGRRAYVASLTDSPTVAKIDAIDLASAQAPVNYLSPATTVSGAGFLAYFREGSGIGYLYVAGHFTPWNIDVFEVPDSGEPYNPCLPFAFTPMTYPIKDGVTAPTAQLGIAQIYVDSVSGDLRIMFGDGTDKLIVVDT